MGIDHNVIQARYNGAASSLYLNYYGGNTFLGASGALGVSSSGVTTTRLLSVNGSSNSGYALTVNASSSSNGINVTDGGSAYLFNATKSGSLAGIFVQKTSASSFDACVWAKSTGSATGVEGNSASGIGIYGTTGNSSSWAGYFSGNVYSSGNFVPSDLTLKKNVQEFTKGIDIIKQLQPKTYQYKDEGDYKLMNLPKGNRYGLIAEDVEKVLPGLVKQTTFQTGTDEDRMNGKQVPAIDFKAVNYTELIPVLIKGMQEQQAIIEQQQSELNELKSLMQALSKQGGNMVTSTAFLKQNVPNPVSNSTVISYYIPDNAGYGQIKITDAKGRLVKTFNAAKGEGQMNIKSNELPAGTYNYTLYIGNKTVDTKQMILIK